MVVKEIIKEFPLQVPAPVYFIPLHENETDTTVAQKTKKLLEAVNTVSLIKEDTLVAVKQHFGEEGCTNYIKPPITAEVIRWIKSYKGLPVLVETNTLYKGERSNSYKHLMLAGSHGFTIEKVGAPVHILDGVHGQNQHPVAVPGRHFSRVNLVSDIPFFNSMVILSHVKGHMLSGMGGALKNLGMGFASRAGKLAQHDDFKPQIDTDACTRCAICTHYCPQQALALVSEAILVDYEKCIGCGECFTACRYDAISFNWAANDRTFQEKMVEHALGAVIRHNKKVVYLNYCNNLAKECDCWGENNPVLYPDVGILASFDPVAIDMASQEIVNQRLGRDIFKELWPEIDSTVQMKYGEEIGLGTCSYEITEVS